jgi:outer membrane lipoprotein SlyB
MTDQRIVERATVIEDAVDPGDPIVARPRKRAPGEPDEMVGGALIGGAGGAVVGAVVGGPVGAVIGGAIGAAAGTTAGAVDEANKDGRVVRER